MFSSSIRKNIFHSFVIIIKICLLELFNKILRKSQGETIQTISSGRISVNLKMKIFPLKENEEKFAILFEFLWALLAAYFSKY